MSTPAANPARTRKRLIEEILASIHMMQNSMHARMMRSTQPERTTHSQIFVLSAIAHRPDTGIKGLADAFGISSSAATQLVDGLVKNGLVIRKMSARDRRALHLLLSAKGRKHVADLKKRYLKTIAALFDTLSEEELRAYLAIHRKVLARIHT